LRVAREALATAIYAHTNDRAIVIPLRPAPRMACVTSAKTSWGRTLAALPQV